MTISKEHRANIEAAIKETEYKYFGMYEFTETQHNAVDLLVSVAQAMLDDEAALESRVLAERKQEPVAWRSKWKTGNQWTYSNSKPYCNPPEKFDVEPLFTHPTPDDASIHARIPKGWRLYTADFSCSGALGSVMLKRDADGEKWWLRLTDEQQEEISLYEFGRGMTIEKALDAAIDRAMQDKESGE
jgi:hypothetical protein